MNIPKATSNNTIKFAKCKPSAIIPSREIGDAGLDIYVCIEPTDDNHFIVINRDSTVNLPTGIRSVIPNDYYIQIEERGSSGAMGIKYGAGVIDASYRGEWFLTATNTTNKIVIIYNANIQGIQKELDDAVNEMIKINKIDSKNEIIFWQTSKALFQGLIHKTYNEVRIEEIPDSEINNYKSKRGSGVMGSSGK